MKAATLSYEALDVPVFEQFNHSFSCGKVHAIVGPSGSGKSTLISALLGLHKPAQGTVEVQLNSEKPIILGDGLDLDDWILHVGYLSQQPFLFQGTVRNNLTLRVPGAKLNEDLTGSLIHELQLDDCLGVNPLAFELQEGGSNLSGGQQQRLALLRALQINKPVLILDEATSALDSELRDVVFDLLRERAAGGCNVILVTHDTELAHRCDDVLDLGTLNNDQHAWCPKPSHRLPVFGAGRLLFGLCRSFGTTFSGGFCGHRALAHPSRGAISIYIYRPLHTAPQGTTQ